MSARAPREEVARTAPAGWGEAVPLEGRHVRLEPLRPDHAAGILSAADDDAVFEHLGTARPTTTAQAEALVQRYLSLPVSPWAQVDLGSGDVAGMTTFYEVQQSLRTVAVGHTWLGRRFWRTPLNTEAKVLLLTHAFGTLGCVRVVWHTDIRNDRSQAAIARLGARREGVLRKHKQRRDGTWRDTVQYAMTDDDWPAARAALESRLAADRTAPPRGR